MREGEENIVNTIVYLNSIGYKINKRVLNFLISEWNNKDGWLFKGINILKEIDPKVKLSKTEINDIQSHNSKYWNILNTLNIAVLYSDQTFYLPTFADFRGRIYPLTNYLSYQGSDVARSLLLFDNPLDNPLDETSSKIKPLNDEGFDCLKVYLANLAGKSKNTWNARIKWTNNNISDLVNNLICNDFKHYTDFIGNLKEPFQYISILFAMIEVLKSLDNNVIPTVTVPILFDASCSGIQHLSAMTRDIIIARKVNILPNEGLDDATDDEILEKAVPQDYYNYAGINVQLELDKEKGILSNIKLNRDLIKKTVMTIPYNITLKGVEGQFKEHFTLTKEGQKYFYLVPALYTKNNKNIFLMPTEFSKLILIIYKNLIKIPSLTELTKYLNKLMTILLKLDQPIIWNTPVGLKINLSSMEFKAVETKSQILKSSKPITIRLPINKKLDKSKIHTAFMPNLIHSLDASNIHLLIPKLTDQPLYTIHDCFATDANNMQNLELFIKEAFIEIYFRDGNYLIGMHNNLVRQILDHAEKYYINDKGENIVLIDKKEMKIPNLPDQFTSTEHNQLFIKVVLKSKFFINFYYI